MTNTSLRCIQDKVRLGEWEVREEQEEEEEGGEEKEEKEEKEGEVEELLLRHQCNNKDDKHLRRILRCNSGYKRN